MKRKLFFASVAIATVLASCTKEEIVNVDNQLQELGNRPMIEAPVAMIGNAGTKMTTNGNYAGVKWEAGDGFGAAVMDIYNAGEEDFEDRFTIVDYINSNVLFSTQDGKTFYAEASMPEGNHLFYAPFNKANISRKALATQFPLEQVVENSSSDAENPSNDIIKAFYEDGTNPVFVAYDKIDGEAKTSINVQMRHIYSLPLVTFKLGEKLQLVDEKGKPNQIEVEVNGTTKYEDVYESEITVNKVQFVNEIKWKGSIVNREIQKYLSVDEDAEVEGSLVWDAVKYETAKTSDIVKFDDLIANKDEKIVVKFNDGQELTANQNGYFFMVLPGDKYQASTLQIKVYATIDGKQYVGYAKPEKEVRLLPGLPYSADEYNADGVVVKDSKGTSMTYVLDGRFTATDEAAAEYNTISNYDDLTNFITKVAYRGEPLEELTATQAANKMKDNTYNPHAHFVITAENDAPIVLDDAFVNTFKNSCVISEGNASINFLGNSKNLVFGDITWDEEADGLFTFDTDVVYAKGNVVMEAAIAKVITLAGAEVTLESEDAVEVVNNAAATVNIDSEAAHNVTSTAGTVNILSSTEANVTNGLAGNRNNTALASKSTLNIADGVIATGTIKNNAHETVASNDTKTMHYAEVNVDAAVVTIENNGKVNVNSDKAKLTVTGTGSVDNTIGAVVKNTAKTNTVYATVSTFEDFNETYDNLCGLNKLVVTGAVEYDVDLDLTGITTIDFNTGSSLSMGAGTWDLTGRTININDNVTWTGRDASVSKMKVDANAIKVANKKVLTIIDINVIGYKFVTTGETTKQELKEALIAGGEVTLDKDYTFTQPISISKPTTLNLNGKTFTGAIVASEDLRVDNGTFVNNNSDNSGIEVTTDAKLTLNNVNIESARHGVRVESTGAVVINGGTYKTNGTAGMTTHALNVGGGSIASNVTINGGTFVGPKGTGADSGKAVNVQAGSKVTILGGDFSGGKNDTIGGAGELIVKGGTFDQNPSAYLADGYKAELQANGKYKVVAE